MSLLLIIIVISAVALGIILLIVLLSVGGGGLTKGGREQAVVNTNLRNLVAAQRERENERAKGKIVNARDSNLAFVAASQGAVNRKKTIASSRMSVQKLLRYGRWSITPLQYRLFQILFSVSLFIPARIYTTIFVQIIAVFLGPLLLSSLLRRSVRKRFEAFDADYPVFLLSYVSLLKTGMNTISGLESAAKGLDEDSLVRSECLLLIERLRLGLSEEQAISAFGSDIGHPEIELFVQGLILSRRFGGALSSTLERLAKQVRKRQEFRKRAVGAVAMEQNSLYFVAGIMTVVMFYLAWQAPLLVFPALEHPVGLKVFQGGLMLIFFGYYWSTRVTDIKI